MLDKSVSLVLMIKKHVTSLYQAYVKEINENGKKK